MPSSRTSYRHHRKHKGRLKVRKQHLKGKGKRHRGKKLKVNQLGGKATDEVVLPLHVSEIARTPWQAWSIGNYVVICVIWTFDAIKKVVDAMKLIQYQFGTERVTFKLIHYIVLGLFVFLTTMIVSGLVMDITYKYWVVAFALYIYSLTCCCGYLLTKTQSVVYLWLVELLQVTWYIALPLRFFLIFHQILPIPVTHSRILATFNEVFVALSMYFSTVFISHTEGFAKDANGITWLSIFIVVIIWLLMYHIVQRCCYELSVTRLALEQTYKKTEAYDNFLYRHDKNRVLIFLLLLLPSFTLNVPTFAFSLVLLPHYNASFVFYRIDMIISVVTMVVSQAFIVRLKFTRDEMKDLYLISIGHILNVCVFIMLLFVVPLASHEPNTEVTRVSTPRDKICQIAIFHAEPWYPNFNVKVNGENPHGEKALKNVHILTVFTHDPRIRLTGYLRNTKVFDQDVSVLQSIKLFDVKENTKRLEEIKWKCPPYKPTQTMWLVINMEDSCGGAGENFKLRYKRKCILDMFSMEDKQGHVFNVPVPNQYRGSVHGELNADSIKYADDKDQHTLDIQKNSIVTFVFTYNEAGELIITPLTWQKLPISSTTTANKAFDDKVSLELILTKPRTRWSLPPLSTASNLLFILSLTFSSIATGIAHLSYLHFIWITCPFENRTLILASFFMLEYAAAWALPLVLEEMSTLLIAVLLVIQIVATVWHILWTTMLRMTLHPLRRNENIDVRRF